MTRKSALCTVFACMVLVGLFAAACVAPGTTIMVVTATPAEGVPPTQTALPATAAPTTAVTATRPAVVVTPTVAIAITSTVVIPISPTVAIPISPTSVSRATATLQPTTTPPPQRPTNTPTAKAAAVTPTRTLTPTVASHTRTLYSEVFFTKVPPPLGDKADTPLYVLELLPTGCEIIEAKVLDYHMLKPVPPASASADHGNHGFSVARSSDNPRDLGVKLHWWYDVGSAITLRIAWTVKEPNTIDCSVPGKTRNDP